jgi:hypothetical protein
MSDLKISLPVPSHADPVVGKGVVTGINEESNPNTKTFTIQNGDRVETTTFEPKDAAAAMPDLGIAAGLKYTALVLTHNKTQAFLVWSVDTPALQNSIIGASTEVQGIGTTNQPIMRGDVFAIRTGHEANGGTGVTFDIYRGNSAVATFSFVVKK